MTDEKTFLVKILKISELTHDVKSFVVEKPLGFSFVSGQATDVVINQKGWRDKPRPFTFASVNDSPALEFVIKRYDAHKSVTKHLDSLREGDELLIGEPWGAIQFKGSGVFIAGGAGVTPFISIFRQLRKENKLLGNTLYFSNKTEADIILKGEFDSMTDLKKVYVLTREKSDSFHQGRITPEFLTSNVSDFSQSFYVCGPVPMVGELTHVLRGLGAHPDSIVVET